MSYDIDTRRGVDKNWTSTGVVILDREIATGQGKGSRGKYSAQEPPLLTYSRLSALFCRYVLPLIHPKANTVEDAKTPASF
jgi:hypothetical protein